MGFAIQFFKDIKTDIAGFLPDQPNDRIGSIALRLLGAGVILHTGASLLTGLSLITIGGPLTAMTVLISTVFKSLVAHDLIKMGYNERARFAGPLLNRAERVVHEAMGAVRALPPFIIEGTLLAKPLYQLATNCMRMLSVDGPAEG
jgi:hypothetical protein